MSLKSFALGCLTAGALVSAGAFAQQHGSMGQMGHMGKMDHSKMSPFQHEMMQTMDRMNKDMMQGMMDPNPGRAWMKSMIPHHRAAVEMSNSVMRHSKDPEILRDARKTADQNARDMRELEAKLK